MAKQPWINLNNWTLGISADKYSGGSFLYGQNINISDNSKSFKISNNITTQQLNTRDCYYVAITWWYGVNDREASFSNDGYIESSLYRNKDGTSVATGWAIYYNSRWYVNAIKLWNSTVGVYDNGIDLFTWDMTGNLFDLWTTVVTNWWLTTATGWTWGTGWTYGAGWATHVTWTTALSQTLTVTNAKQYRVAVSASGITAGSCVIAVWWTTIVTLTSDSDKRSMWVRTTASTSESLTITPSTDFDWTIANISVCVYSSALTSAKASITAHDTHPLLAVAWYIYVGSWPTLDAINTTSRSVDSYNLIDSTYDIVGLCQIGNAVVIFATDWEDSKQYYWDRVSDVVTEVILWKDKKITWIRTDGTSIYVVTENNFKKELYVCAWYQRQLLAVGRSNWKDFGEDKECYRLDHRNDFYIADWLSNVLGYVGNKLYIPAYNGIYTYGFENPWANPALVKEFVIDSDNISAIESIQWKTYIAHDNNISYLTTYENQSASWYVVTTPILWDNFSSTKQLNRFRIGYILPSDEASIKLYISANDYFFRTFYVSGITTAPVAWDRCNSWEGNTYEVISTDITAWAWYIYCYSTNFVDPQLVADWQLTMLSWDWDTSITYNDSENFVKLKTITAKRYTQWNELIFGQEFLLAFMPFWQSIQIKIEITSTSTKFSPEVFDIPILAEQVQQNG